MGHVRTASAPDATTGAQQAGRKWRSWKPQLETPQLEKAQSASQEESNEAVPAKIFKLVRSSSAELLSKFSPDSSPDDDKVNLRKELEKELDDIRLSIEKILPFRKYRSASPLRHSDIPAGAANVARAASTTVSRTPQNANMQPKHGGGGGSADASAGAQMPAAQARRMTFDELKNKPLPKIAAL